MHTIGSVGIFNLMGTTDHSRLYTVRSTCPTDDLMRTFLDRPYEGDHVMLLHCQEQSASVRVEPALATHKTSPMSDSHSYKSSTCILSICHPCCSAHVLHLASMASWSALFALCKPSVPYCPDPSTCKRTRSLNMAKYFAPLKPFNALHSGKDSGVSNLACSTSCP